MDEIQKYVPVDKETTMDRINAWYLHGEDICKLTEKEEEIRRRWEAAFAMLLNFHSRAEVAQKLSETQGISVTQAHRDVNDALRLFGDVYKSNKEGQRHILYEYALKTWRLAASAKPPDIGQMNKAISNMIKITGIDKDNPDMPDFSKLKPNEYNITLPDPLVKLLMEMVKNGSVNLSDFIQPQATDAQIIPNDD